MGVIGGIGGGLGSVPGISNWQISHVCELKEYVASNTKSGVVRVPGNKDWSGTAKVYGHTPPILPGASFTFSGSIDGAIGATGTAVMESTEISIPIEEGGVISQNLKFSGNSALTIGASAIHDTSEVVNGFSASGLKVYSCAYGGEYAAVPEVRSATITLTRKLTEYVSSSTAGYKGRKAGNFDATLALPCYCDDLADLLQPGTFKKFKVEVTSLLYWELYFMLIGENSNIQADVEGNAIVGAQINASFSGYLDDSGTRREGKIVTPAGVTWWPEATS